MAKSQKKAAILIHRIGPYHVARLKALSAAGFEVHALEVVNQDSTYQWDVIPDIDGVRRTTLFPNEKASKRVGKLWKRINDALSEIRPDCVGVPGWGTPAALGSIGWCRRNAVTAVLMSDSTAGDAPRTVIRESIKKFIVGATDAGLVGGQLHAAYLQGLGMRPSVIHDKYDVIDNKYFTNPPCPDAGRAREVKARFDLPGEFLLTVCRLVPKKNLTRLIEAHRLAKSRSRELMPLVIVGSGPLAGIIDQLAEQSNASIKRIPFVQYQDLPWIYSAASGFVLASTTDQWGLVVNEAMASGLPVLVSKRCGSAADLVLEGLTGWTFDPYNVNEMAVALTSFQTKQKDCWEKVGRQAAVHIENWAPSSFAASFAKAAQSPARPASRSTALILRWIAELLSDVDGGASLG